MSRSIPPVASLLLGLAAGCGGESVDVTEFDGYGRGMPGSGLAEGGEILMEKLHLSPGAWGGETSALFNWFHGFQYGGDDIGMAVDLSTLPEEVPAPADFVVERVSDEAGLAEWASTFGSGFGIGQLEVAWIGEMLRRLGYGDEGAWRHYLGRLSGESVATSSLFFAAGVAGVYCVSTVERARRQGIGAAVTLAALHEAQNLGYSVGVLGSSEMGYGVYRGLGFEEYCRIGLYEWRPS